ncbi:MAG: DUF6273 domain-containing protein [Evtepia sp.]|nr:DUF6273 domain-containing protein [Evtepia sp.]
MLKLNERGKPIKFIVLGHDHYGAGTGTTLIRKDTYTTTAFIAASTNNLNAYMGSTLDNICDCVFPQRLDQDIQSCMVNTPIVVAQGGGVKTLHTLQRRGWALSCTEVGLSGYATEGTLFSYFSDNEKRVAYLDETTVAVFWGLRSPYSDSGTAYYVRAVGTLNGSNVYNPSFAARPAFNLLSSIVVSNTTDADGCYTVEDTPAGAGGLYAKNNGVWVRV